MCFYPQNKGFEKIRSSMYGGYQKGIAPESFRIYNTEKHITIYRKDFIPMEELYRLIEEKIKAAGYPGEIDGREFYGDISDEADEKENGTYMFLIKKSESLSYQGCMTIMDEEFDLHYVDIHDGPASYHVDFDA